METKTDERIMLDGQPATEMKDSPWSELVFISKDVQTAVNQELTALRAENERLRGAAINALKSCGTCHGQGVYYRSVQSGFYTKRVETACKPCLLLRAALKDKP